MPTEPPGCSASEVALHGEGIRRVGHDDFGEPKYRQALRVVLAAYDGEAKFHEARRGGGRALVQKGGERKGPIRTGYVN